MKKITKEQAFEILEEYGTPPHVIRHCEAVYRVAYKVGLKMQEKGVNVDPELAMIAGLLHDMARVYDDHQAVAADWLRERGYDELADIIAVHMTYSTFNDIEKTTETDLVCLGDRVCIEGEYVGIEKRFEYIINKAARNAPQHIQFIRSKEYQMKSYIRELEKYIGITLDELMAEDKKTEKQEYKR